MFECAVYHRRNRIFLGIFSFLRRINRAAVHAHAQRAIVFLRNVERNRDDAVPDWWVHEHRVPPDTSAVLLFDLRADGV